MCSVLRAQTSLTFPQESINISNFKLNQILKNFAAGITEVPMLLIKEIKLLRSPV